MTALLAATFLLLQLLCQVFATDASECEPPSDYVTHPDYNAAYKIHLERATWAEARDRCIAEGAHLAVITSEEQIQKIVNYTLLESEFYMYTGIRRSATTSPWVRVDNGLPVTFSDFFDSKECNCVVIWRGAGGTFTDFNCFEHFTFVCETSLTEGCANQVGHQD